MREEWEGPGGSRSPPRKLLHLGGDDGDGLREGVEGGDLRTDPGVFGVMGCGCGHLSLKKGP